MCRTGSSPPVSARASRTSTGDLTGDVVWVGRKGPELFDSGAPIEPAFTFPTWDAPQEMFHYATCARLLNYPDAEGEAGRQLVPEVAEDLPEVSDGGRTFTFRIREGFRLLAPVGRGGDGRVVPACRRARESSSRSSTATSSRPPLANIVGAQAYYAGKTPHVSGISVEGDKLVIRLREPAPDLPWLVAASSCAVPVDTPVVPGGLEKPVPRPGPTTSPRSPTRRRAEAEPELRRLAAAAARRDRLRVQCRPGEAADADRERDARLLPRVPERDAAPEHAAARAAGDRYRLTPYNRIQFFALQLPTGRSSQTSACVARCSTRSTAALSQTRTRREALPATRLLYPSILGYDDDAAVPASSRPPHGAQARRRAKERSRRLHLGRSGVHRRLQQ